MAYIYNSPYNSDYNKTVSGTSDCDTIYNFLADHSIINSGSGDDYINNDSQYVTINSGDGNDTIYNYSGYSMINSDAGDDYIKNWRATTVNINSGDGNDTIYNYGGRYGYTKINSGSGDDSIHNDSSGENVTIVGGIGNDTIRLYEYSKSFIQYVPGDGNDLITGFTSDNATIQIINDEYTTMTSGDDVIIKVGSGRITLKDAKDETPNIESITDTTKSGSYSTLPNGLTYNNNKTTLTVKSPFTGIINTEDYDSNVKTIDASRDTNFVTIYGNEKANIIKAGGGGSALYGQAGADSLYGGSGNDTFFYADGDGNDVIFNYTAGKDKIKLTSGSISKSSTSGTDVILTVGKGSIKLKNAAGKKITVIDSAGKTTTKTYGSALRKINTKTQQQVIKELMNALDTTTLTGVKALDYAIKQVSNGIYSSTNDLIKNHFLTDIKSEKNNMIASGNYFLKNYCDIVLNNNNDTGAISGYDAGGNKIPKISSTIIPENGNLIKIDTFNTKEKFDSVKSKNKDIDRDGKTLIFTKKGLTIKVPNYYKSSTSYEPSLSNVKNTVINGLYSWWIEEGLKLIENSYGLSFQKSNVTFTESKLVFFDKDNEDVAAEFRHDSKDLRINLARCKSLDLDEDKDGIMSLSDGSTHSEFLLDRLITHELTHAAMDSNIKSFVNMPLFFKEGAAELIHGADDQNRSLSALVSLYANDTNKELEKVLTTNIIVGNIINKIPLINKITGDYNYAYGGGYMLLRYFAKQVSNNSGLPDGVLYSGDQGTLNVKAPYKGTIDLANYSSNTTKIDASHNTNNLTLKGNAKANVIKAGTGGSNITGDKGADTLYGGSGVDVFNYASGDGKDVIINYTAGKDKIRLTSGSISNSKISGKDVILTIGSGSITVKNVAGKKITVVDSQGKETSKVYGTSLRNYVEKLWFDVDDNFANDEINAISQSNMNSIENIINAVGKITTYDANTISNNNSPDLVFVSNLTKKK